MARRDPNERFAGRAELRRAPGLAGRQMARTRSGRYPKRVRNSLGLKFFLVMIALVLSAAVFTLSGEAVSAFTTYTEDLPPVTELSSLSSFKSTQIFDRNGTLLYEVDDQNGGRRFPVYLSGISQDLIDATIATEDKDFYSNPGIDPAGIVRAVWQDLSQGGLVQGASTITQQLAKNVLISREERNQKSYARKIKEAVLAVRISDSYSKNQILEMYLNEVYYGHRAYGVEAAAQTYFGKSARDLTLAEASLLAGLPQAPSAYDPLLHVQAAKDRQAHVLDRMVEQNYITPEDATRAKAAKLDLKPQQDQPLEAPHFVMYVRQLLEQKYGTDVVYQGGLKVTTTLDLNTNKLAEKAIQDHMDSLRTQNANNAALVAIDPKTGEIIAMVGSRDFYDTSIDGQVNLATSPRQPGSTIKPIEYSLALMKGWGPETVITDDQTDFPNTSPALPPYRPHNFDYKFDGPMTIRYALANSKNIPAVKALMFDTVPDFVKYAGDPGHPFPERRAVWTLPGAGRRQH